MSIFKDTLIPANKNRKWRAGARPQAGQFRRVSRAGTSSVVAAYTGLSHSFRAIEAYTAERCFPYKKSPPHSVDTERGNGYNTYRVRPKRSANNSWLFHLEDNRPDYGRAVIFCVSLLLWTWFRLKKQKEARTTSTCATPPFGWCADRRLPLVLYL